MRGTKGEAAVKKVMHMIGNAHIDPVWLWRWTDGYSEVRSTFRSALDRMKEYPDFIFTCAAGAYYEWVEKSDPGMFSEIRERVREGRWRIVGGWWIQPDCNIPSGESFARQGLIAQRYFQEKFGVTAHTGYNVDSFGHSGMLPKILPLLGMKNYVYMRPGWHEKSYPAWTFLWQSPEGEAVRAFRIPFEYCTWGKELTDTIQRVSHEIQDENGMMCFYGVGNHGGGPTRENIESILALNGKDGVELRFSDPDAFFDSLSAKELPVVNGELLHHASGCYAGHSAVKKWNRQAENRLLTAEKFSSLAWIAAGKKYPLDAYNQAWKKVLFNQFHDILAGCCLKEGYDDAREDFGFALSTAAEHMNEAQQTLLRLIALPFEEGAFHYAVFNPHAFPSQAPVMLEIANYKGKTVLCDAEGREVPFQLTPGSAAANGRRQLHFVAQVPPMGWQVYHMRPAEGEMAEYPEDTALTLRNEWTEAAFEPQLGLTALRYLSTQTDMLRGPVEMWVNDDPSDTWSHSVLHFDKRESSLAVRDVRVTASGPVFKTIRVVYQDADSALTQDYTLYRELPQVFIRNRLDWYKRQKLLKMHLPVNLHYNRVSAQAAFGFVDRLLDGVEYPMHEYVDMTGVSAGQGQPMTGLAVLNDCKYAYSAQRSGLDITLVRSPYYANHEPFQVEEGMDYPTVDWGRQEFTLALLPHAGAFYDGGVEEAAMLLNAPLTILAEGAHDGKLLQRESLLSLTGCHAVVDAVKMAQDGSNELILHMHETARQEGDAVLSLPFAGQKYTLHFHPGQIRCVRVSLPDGAIRDVNLLEE